LSLLLSFFITIDIHRIRGGVLRLRQSRMRDFYDEIAPGLYTFGRLIGRAFQAQGVIAFFNTFLTFLALNFLQIKNEVFLCAIVFVCSFIPVLGVVLSSIPIAVMAIVQPGGTVFLGLKAIGAILVIHFIETSILNPKILGDMLHLHPVMVLAVLAVGEHFFGVWGLLLSVPVTVYILRCVILNEEIPGLIEPARLAAAVSGKILDAKPPGGKSSFVLETGAEKTLPETSPPGPAGEPEGSERGETVSSSGKVGR
jgi:predicted PurR-regulated permease PerM